MNAKLLTVFVALLSVFNSGCAIGPFGASARNSAQEVKIYEQAQIPQQRYETLKYLWADSWRNTFWSPTWSSPEEGKAALQVAAGRLGANGLISVACYADTGGLFVPLNPESYATAFACSGTAIRVR